MRVPQGDEPALKWLKEGTGNQQMSEGGMTLRGDISNFARRMRLPGIKNIEIKQTINCFHTFLSAVHR